MPTKAKKNPSFRKTKKAAAKIGVRLPSSKRIKEALKWPGRIQSNRALNALLRAALGQRKSARAKIRRGAGGRLELLVSPR